MELLPLLGNRSCLVAATLALPFVGGSASARSTEKPSMREVLPDSVVPIHYDLALSPDADTLIFSGTVSITVEVKAATSDIVLNADGLVLDHRTIDGEEDVSVAMDEKLGRATLHWKAAITKGRHVLQIKYHGKIGRNTLGFFAMDYATAAGPRRTLATNFEPAAARQLFPCWDEPERKATFTVSVDAPMDRMALSNMPVAEVTPLSSTMQRVRFAVTPKMSTYVLFLGIGDFERIHRTVGAVDVGVVVKRGDTAKAAYALDEASRLLPYYNDYFGVAYPLPKLDLIAAPGRISGGAMENWGAIFYSQEILLFDPDTSTERDRQGIFLTVSHEMAHQWFGDLVTMTWWDDLWLNEGFARWMQTFAADDLHPEWNTRLRASSIFEDGKSADAVPSTHPVVQQIYTAEQAAQSFDSITYNKGAAIITMMNAYLGRESFREGVRRYMRVHAYGNSVDTDLWSEMQKVARKPILGVAHDLTRQEGVPLVRVSTTAEGTRLSQERFAADPSTLQAISAQTWRLPLVISSPGGTPRQILLQKSADLAERGPLVVNAGQNSYVRVLYAPDAFAALVSAVGRLDSIDQLGLLNDAVALGPGGYAPASNALRVASAIPPDADPIVWQRVIAILAELDSLYSAGPSREAFRRFALRLLAPVAAHLGAARATGEDANREILRSDVFEAQAALDDPDAIARARKILSEGKGTAAEARSAMTIVAAHADAASFETLLARTIEIADPLEKQYRFVALAGVEDPALARRFIDVALGEQAPAGSKPRVISHIARAHPDLAWELIAPRLNDPKVGIETTWRWRVAIDIAGRSANPQRIADLEAYASQNVPENARKPFAGAVASIRLNAHIAKDILPELDRWIAAH